MSVSFVVCGLEHTGTTLLSDLFRQVPKLDSGFEVGVLLSESPSAFKDLQPFAGNMKEGWGISQQQFEHCCSQPTLDAFYQELKSQSASISQDCENLFDKTPRYLSQLSSCLERIDTPFIASYKDPRAIVHSDFKRAKKAGAEDFFEWYDKYVGGKHQYVSMCYREHQKNKDNPRVEFIALEELALNARNSMQRLFDHVNLEFSLDYILLNGLRYKNTRSNAVSIPIAFSYLADFDKEITDRIEADFSDFSDWFYS